MRKDIDLSFQPNPLTGDLSVKTGNNAVEQSMKNLILTSFYERGFNVEVGSTVSDSLFENYTFLERQTLLDSINQVINNFEPDVDIQDVTVEQDNNDLVAKVYYTVFNEETVRITTIPIQRIR